MRSIQLFKKPWRSLPLRDLSEGKMPTMSYSSTPIVIKISYKLGRGEHRLWIGSHAWPRPILSREEELAEPTFTQVVINF